MEAIRSKSNPGIITHVIICKDDFSGCQREDISDPCEPLQVSCLSLESGHEFRPHKHITKHATIVTTQEAWVVIEGHVNFTLYDLDGEILAVRTLRPGDCGITYRGGHGYRAASDCLVFEFKTGPYFGQKKDKEYYGD